MKTIIVLLASALTAYAQVTSGRLEGNVTDAQGAAVVGASVRVANLQTGQSLNNTTDSRGYWVVPSLSTATYRVTVSHPGFKTATLESVKIDAGVPATANIVLEVGAVSETIEVQGGAEVLQASTATVSSVLVGQQLHELPFTSRNLTELIVTQPGAATPGIPRSSSVNGLPQGSLNVTLDGLNIQDNSNKSSDGFFNSIFPRADAIEEMTVTTAAAGAESTGEGATQVKFVTRSGTNEFHGGLFWQHRNTALNANYYFNNINGLPRDRILLNQAGGFIGGPIKKEKVFFFAHFEAFRLPQTYSSPAGQTLLTPEAIQGLFRYRDAGGAVRGVDLFGLARGGNFPSTADPLVASTLAQINTLSRNGGSIQSRIDSNADYNRNNYSFQSNGANNRNFPTVKLDWNATSKHHLDFTYNYQTNLRSPDGINIGTASPILPGTGAVLNGEAIGSQGGIVFSGVGSLRSALTPRLTSEIRFGVTGGNVIFNNGISPSDFTQWKGYAPIFNYVSNPYRTTGQSRRSTPLKQGSANITWSKAAHLWNFGGSFTQVNAWSSNITGTQFVPSIAFGAATNDPVNFGSTALFTAVNFPGATPANLTEAAGLYTLLTGRVSAINRQAVLGEDTNSYGQNAVVVRNRQREIALYFQDAWRVRQGLTVNYGLRWDRQGAPESLLGLYSRPGYEGVWGVSGVGNLFQPGTLTGKVPVYNAVPAGTPAYSAFNKIFNPSVGLAWVLPKFFGKSGSTVFRAGYSISTIREDAGRLDAVWGANQGRTVSTTVDPVNTPGNFGAPGSVLFRDGSLPSRTIATTPAFPISVIAGNAVRDFDPNLRVGYVQSWNVGLQRELTKDTVFEVRYVANHGTKLWRQINLNEVNIIENGFLSEFQVAQNNLAIARQTNSTSTQFAGLPGQSPLPIIQTALGTNSDTTTAILLSQGQAGGLANNIATTSARMARLTAAGYPSNLFLVNPTTGSGAASLYVNGGDTNYNSLQLELRRRMSQGLLMQASYVWSHAINNEFSNGVAGSFVSLRNYELDKGPSPFDIRHALKMNWIYELPFGSKRRWIGSLQNPVARRAVEGWSLASVARVQSGSPDLLQSGRNTLNLSDSGVQLYNITASELQDMISIRKTSGVVAGRVQGIVYFLPQSIIDNTLAAFEVGGKTLRDLDPSKPYVGPPTTPGKLGSRVFLYSPWQQKWDFSVVKKTSLGERRSLEFRAQFLNAFNLVNFLLGAPGNAVNTLTVGSGFGQTLNSYRDLSNTNDPGSRIIEFSLRFNF